MLNRLLNSTGKKLRLYVAEAQPARGGESHRAPVRSGTAPEKRAEERTAAQPVAVRSGTMTIRDALEVVAQCGDPAEAIAALEAAGLSPQRAAVMGGISISAYEALRDASRDSGEWTAFCKSAAVWRDRLGHS